MYKNRKIIQEKAFAILSGVTIATFLAIIVVYFTGRLTGASEPVLLSLIPKSVTTPIAIDVSKTIGGIPALTTAGVIFTGMLGATFNHKLLAIFGIKMIWLPGYPSALLVMVSVLAFVLVSALFN